MNECLIQIKVHWLAGGVFFVLLQVLTSVLEMSHQLPHLRIWDPVGGPRCSRCWHNANAVTGILSLSLEESKRANKQVRMMI